MKSGMMRISLKCRRMWKVKSWRYWRRYEVCYLKKFEKAKKKDIIKLVAPKLSDVLDDKKKENKVRNLLSVMKTEGIIDTDSDNKRRANWMLIKKCLRHVNTPAPQSWGVFWFSLSLICCKIKAWVFYSIFFLIIMTWFVP